MATATRTPETVLCECGCGATIPAKNKRSEPARFKHGHNGAKPYPLASEKACHRCGEVKPREDFFKVGDARLRDDRRPECKDCTMEYQRAHRDPEKAKAYQAEYHRRNREARAEKARRYYRENRDKLIPRIEAWRKANLDKVRRHQQKAGARRRAQKRQAPIGVVDLDAVYGVGNLCGICGDVIEEPPHVDHILPLAAGGEHATANLQLAHPRCNLAKGGRV